MKMTTKEEETPVAMNQMKSVGRGRFLTAMVREADVVPRTMNQMKIIGRGRFQAAMAREPEIVPCTFIPLTSGPNVAAASCPQRRAEGHTIPHCRKCCTYELWVPPTGQTITYSGDQFIN